MDSHSARDKAHFVHELFESIAPRYDRMNTLLSFRRHKIWRKYAMQKMNVLPGDSAVDICCGTCDWTISLAQASQTGKVVGLDFSEKMLEIGQEKISGSPDINNIELVQGDAMKLPFADNSFNHATIGFALRNVNDVERVLSEMMRVVKPGGQVVSLELSKPTWKPFRALYYLYFQRILPLLGYVFAKSYNQYRWLPESLIQFPDYKELEKIMVEKVGLKRVTTTPLTGGIVALHIGKKPLKGE